MDDIMGSGFDASLSPDGSTLFFLRRNDGVYWVDAGVIEDMRPESRRGH